MKKSLKKWHIALIVLGTIFIFLAVFNNYIWFDEAYSCGIVRHTFKEIWTIGGNDVHPILYYWALRIIYLITGGSIIVYKIFSAIPIAIMAILGYTHIRKDFGEKTGFIFSFLSIFLPEMITYAGEVRMYSWAILSVTILAIYAYRLSKEDNTKNWIIFGISSLISIWLHYYGLMVAGLINIVLLIHLIKNKRKKGLIFIISFGLVQAISYIPWLINLITQLSHVSGGFWIGFSFPQTPMELLGGQMAGSIELAVPTVLALELYAYMIYKTYKLAKLKEDLKPFKLAVGIYFAVIIAALVVTVVLHTLILYYRYLFVITGLYIFAISFILNKEENKFLVCSIIVIIGILGTYNNIKLINENYNSSNKEPLTYIEENIKYADTVIYTEPSGGQGATVAIHCPETQIYFYNEENWGVEEAYKAFNPNYNIETSTEFIDKINGRIWIIDNPWGETVEKLFGDETKYKKVSEETIYTKYHDYSWKFTLIEKVNY